MPASLLTAVNAIFTLLELLIVISIIMILTAILLPAFKNVREKGKEITCANSLKQIGLIMIMYVQDNNEWIAGYHRGSSSVQSDWWPFRLNDYDMKNAGAALNCPAQMTASKWLSAYALNYNFGANTSLVKVTQVGKISSKGYIGDSPWSGNVNSWALRPYYIGGAEGVNDAQNRCAVSLRHKQGANVLFLDGHSRWLPEKSFPPDTGSDAYAEMWVP